MGWGEGIRSVDRIAWPGESGLNNAKPRLKGGQPGPYNPAKARTPQDALSYIELLYKSGHMEDLAKLLRRSQVFRAAWLILQQSSPEVSVAGREVSGTLCREESGKSALLPVPVSGPPSLPFDPEPVSPGPKMPGVATTELSSQRGRVSDEANDSFPRRPRATHPLSLFLQAYLNQDVYWARENQRGQLVSIRA
jgi:hypothetical protein